MNEQSVHIDQLKLQLQTLNNDKTKTKEKLFEIMGAIKLVEFFISEIQQKQLPTISEVNTNGS